MNLGFFRLFLVSLLSLTTAFLLASCGGGGSSTSAVPANGTGTTSGDPDKAQRVMIHTGDDATPYVLADIGGSVSSFHVNDQNKLSALSMIGESGLAAKLDIDPISGYPTQLTTENGIFVFENIREESGLIDVAFLQEGEETQIFRDVNYLASQNGSTNGDDALIDDDPADDDPFEEEIEVTPLSYKSSLAVLKARDTRARDDNIFGNGNAEKLAEGAMTAGSLASCSLVAIFVAGAVLDPLLIPLIQATPLLGGLLGGGAIAGCGAKVVSVLRRQLTDVDTNFSTTTQGVADSVHVTARVYESIGACAEELMSFNCIWKAGYAAFSTLNETTKRSYAKLQQIRDLLKNNKGLLNTPVYCCDGPRKVEIDRMSRWRTLIHAEAAAEGYFVAPYQYEFDFGDTEPNTILKSGNPSYQVSNVYHELGEKEISVRVTDSKGKTSKSIEHGEPFLVEVVETGELMDLTCCDGPQTVHVDQQIEWQVSLGSGRKPYRFTMDWGDETSNTYRSNETTDVPAGVHTYMEKGDVEIRVSATDDLGDEKSSNAFDVKVIDPLEVECCTGPSGANQGDTIELTFQAANVAKPYRYEIDWDDGTITALDGKRVTRVAQAHTFLNSGDHYVSVTITDASGAGAVSVPYKVDVREKAGVSSGIKMVLFYTFDEILKHLVLDSDFNELDSDIQISGTAENLLISWRGGAVATMYMLDLNNQTQGFVYALDQSAKGSFENNIQSPLRYGDYAAEGGVPHEDAFQPAKKLEKGHLYNIVLERYTNDGSGTEEAFINFRVD